MRGIKVKDVDKTPVIFLTGDADLSTVRFAKEHNVNGYLVKPISLAKLRDSIDAVVSSNFGMAQWLT